MSAEIRRHWTAVAELRCLISRAPSPTLHHAHGGSMLELPWPNPGMGQKQNDWLVIPLAAVYHTGRYGIDTGMGLFKSVVEWERYFGTQVGMLKQVSAELGYDVFERAGIVIDR